MNKFIPILLASLLLSACADSKNINGVVYPTYGLLNEGSKKSDRVCYETSVGNVVWSVILIETIVIPIYLVGFSLYEPTELAGPQGQCGIDKVKT